MKKKRGIIISCILTIILGWNVFQYVLLWQNAKCTLKQEIVVQSNCDIDLLGLMDSYGVNYNPNITYNFQDYLAMSLKEQGHLSSSLNLFNLYCNKTWELDGVYNNAIKLDDFAKMQNYSLDFTRHKYGDQIRSDLIYKAPSGLGYETVYNYTASLRHPVILYSCTANDLFYYYNVSLESMSFEKILELVKNWKKGLELLKDEVGNNMETLLSCNPNSQIFVMGLYIPTDNFFLQRFGAPFVNTVNKQIEIACSRYDNAYYVDCSSISFSVLEGDFHPDADGQYQIAVKLAEAINENLKDFSEESSDVSHTKKEIIQDDFGGSVGAVDVWRQMNKDLLPMGDYVEFGVAAEKAMQELGKEDISAAELEMIKSQFTSFLRGNRLVMMQQAFDIMIIERKIHQGFELNFYTLNEFPENDKLSLINYY